MQPELIENNPPLGVILRIWWGMTWRIVLWVVAFLIPLVIFQFGFAFFLGMGMGMEQEDATFAVQVSGVILGWCAGFVATCAAIKNLIGRRFGVYRLLLVKDAPAV